MTTTHLYIVAKDRDSYEAFLSSQHWIDANRCIHVDPSNSLASVFFISRPLVVYLYKPHYKVFFKGARILELPKD